MNSRDDATYRLVLAKGYLAKAESNATDERWDDCLANAQEAVENAGKAILSHFRPVPKRHDVLEPLRDLLGQKEVPPTAQKNIKDVLDAFEGMGLDAHIRATYGDEVTNTPPWDLIDKPEAMAGLAKARQAVALAVSIFAEMTQPPSSGADSSTSAE